MGRSRRQFIELGSLATIAAIAGCGQQRPTDGGASPEPEDEPTDAPDGGGTEPTSTPAQPTGAGRDVTVRQPSGRTFYWVLPGPRRLSPTVFGTPDTPRLGSNALGHAVSRAQGRPPGTVPELLQDLPFLVAAPEGARAEVDNPIAHQRLTVPTLYSDEARITSGEFEVTYMDRQPWDTPGPPGETVDDAELSATFEDPAGNTYELELDHVVKPPIPGYETGGGVITNAWHHGLGLPGSPLMPRVYTYGAFWALGDVVVNGEVADENKVIHFMTTQTVRDADYRIALDEELPLPPDNTPAGLVHHTHGVVLPIKGTPDGPVFDPVRTAFELPNGQNQPFIHAMWEQEELVSAPFRRWTPTDETAGNERTVRAHQPAGRTFYWVLPGPRRLSPSVFGTPDDPDFGAAYLEWAVERAKGLPEPLSNAIPQLLEDLPFLVAAPEGVRASVDDQVAHQQLTAPTLYSDEARITSGELDITYRDRRPYDMPGPPGETPDTIDLSASFTDPAGHAYELVFDHVVQAPIPGYETGGGVLTGAWHHGSTGTGSPLMPRVYSYGATWFIGHVRVDGEVVDENKVMHFMTTQTIRDADYRIALDEEMPLAPDGTIAGQLHHTHGVVLPVTATADGPVFEPVETAFELPTGQNQPFIHAMWEQEELSAPFAGWSPR